MSEFTNPMEQLITDHPPVVGRDLVSANTLERGALQWFPPRPQDQEDPTKYTLGSNVHCPEIYAFLKSGPVAEFNQKVAELVMPVLTGKGQVLPAKEWNEQMFAAARELGEKFGVPVKPFADTQPMDFLNPGVAKAALKKGANPEDVRVFLKLELETMKRYVTRNYEQGEALATFCAGVLTLQEVEMNAASHYSPALSNMLTGLNAASGKQYGVVYPTFNAEMLEKHGGRPQDLTSSAVVVYDTSKYAHVTAADPGTPQGQALELASAMQELLNSAFYNPNPHRYTFAVLQDKQTNELRIVASTHVLFGEMNFRKCSADALEAVLASVAKVPGMVWTGDTNLKPEMRGQGAFAGQGMLDTRPGQFVTSADHAMTKDRTLDVVLESALPGLTTEAMPEAEFRALLLDLKRQTMASLATSSSEYWTSANAKIAPGAPRKTSDSRHNEEDDQRELARMGVEVETLEALHAARVAAEADLEDDALAAPAPQPVAEDDDADAEVVFARTPSVAPF